MASLKNRDGTWYAQYYVGGKRRMKSLRTKSKQIAKGKLRKLEDALAGGEANPLPGRTPTGKILQAYTEYIRARKTPKSAQTDIYYLRQVFGEICDGLKDTSRRGKGKTATRPRRKKKKAGADLRHKPQQVQARYFERITTAELSAFLTAIVRQRGLAPKTANRYREILCRLFNWAMSEGGVRMPADINPAARLERYRQKAPKITFMTTQQIEKQLNALAGDPQLQVMVAVYIYAGLRREELLWLTVDDVDLDYAGTENGLIRVRAKVIDGEEWEPKTKVNRVIPISRALRRYLDSYSPPATKGGWYFPSPEGRRYDPDNFSRRRLATAQKAAGLSWSCWIFRHTFGSHLAMQGVSLYKISKLMGNSPAICRTHYAHLTTESLDGVVDFHEPPGEKPRSQPTLRLVRPDDDERDDEEVAG